MSEGQVKGYDDVSTFEEDLASADMGSDRTALQEPRDSLELGDSTPPDPGRVMPASQALASRPLGLG